MIEPIYMLLLQAGSLLGFLAAMATCIAFFLIWRVTRDKAYLLLGIGMLIRWLVAAGEFFSMMIFESLIASSGVGDFVHVVLFMGLPMFQGLSNLLLLIGGILLSIRAVKVFRGKKAEARERPEDD